MNQTRRTWPYYVYYVVENRYTNWHKSTMTRTTRLANSVLVYQVRGCDSFRSTLFYADLSMTINAIAAASELFMLIASLGEMNRFLDTLVLMHKIGVAGWGMHLIDDFRCLHTSTLCMLEVLLPASAGRMAAGSPESGLARQSESFYEHELRIENCSRRRKGRGAG